MFVVVQTDGEAMLEDIPGYSPDGNHDMVRVSCLCVTLLWHPLPCLTTLWLLLHIAAGLYEQE